ncbi:MAG: hypothetical protein SFV17_03410 [Candidatus Obscuribacter sp.]|nr:hypothetical protein [Candidatus Obscuribacter sp.]
MQSESAANCFWGEAAFCACAWVEASSFSVHPIKYNSRKMSKLPQASISVVRVVGYSVASVILLAVLCKYRVQAGFYLLILSLFALAFFEVATIYLIIFDPELVKQSSRQADLFLMRITLHFDLFFDNLLKRFCGKSDLTSVEPLESCSAATTDSQSTPLESALAEGTSEQPDQECGIS